MTDASTDQKMLRGAVSDLHSTPIAALAAGEAGKARTETVGRILGRAARRGVETAAFTSAV